MLTQITGFFVHLSHLQHMLIHLHILACHHVHHPNGWICQLTTNPGGPNK